MQIRHSHPLLQTTLALQCYHTAEFSVASAWEQDRQPPPPLPNAFCLLVFWLFGFMQYHYIQNEAAGEAA